MANNRSYKTVIIAIQIVVIAVLAMGIYVYAQTGGTYTISEGIYPHGVEASIWVHGSTYYMKTDFGVLTSGSNATTLIQAAHDGLPTSGGTIYFHNGDYEISGANGVTISTQNVTIKGESWGAVITPATGVTRLFYVSGAHFRMTNMKLRGESVSGSHGVLLSATADESTIDHCLIHQFDHSAIEAQAGCNVLFIHDNYLACTGNSTSSATLALGSCADSIISNNQIGGGYYTVYGSSNAYNQYRGNKIFGNILGNYYTVYMDNPRYVTIADNIIGSAMTRDGIYMIASSSGYGYGNIITGNIIYEYVRDGIRLDGDENLRNNTICDNVFRSTVQTGYAIWEAHGWTRWTTIDGNTFLNMSPVQAIYIKNETSRCINNFGYNPLGFISLPWENTAGYYILDRNGDAAVPSDNQVYTCMQSPKFIIVHSGTVSAIKIDGQTTGLTSGTFYVKPSQTFEVEWTGAPTVLVFGE